MTIAQSTTSASADAPSTIQAMDTIRFQAELFGLLRNGAGTGELLQLQKHGEEVVREPEQRRLLAESVQAAFSIQKLQAIQLQREKGLLAVLETAQDLTAIRDLELVLQAIVRRARQIFATDIGYLTNYDRVRNDFYIRATDGATSDRFRNVRVPPEHGICGHVLKHKTPYHCTNYMQDQGFIHDNGIDLAIAEEGVCSLLGAPLMVGNHCIGILCVCDRQPRSHEPWEISMLATLAAQAAIAIENARLFQETQVALQQVSQANAMLHQQTTEIADAAEAHEQMTKLAARGGTVTDILQMVASLLGGEVALLNEAEQLSYHASAPQVAIAPPLSKLFQDIAVQDLVHKALTQSRLSGQSQTVEPAPGLVLKIAAITGANGLLGAMLMLSRGAISDTQVRTFERGALVAGVALLSEERSKHALSSRSIATIRSLVTWQQEPASVLQALTEPLGLDLNSPVRMMVLHIESNHLEYALRRLRPRLPSSALMEPLDGLIVAVYAARHAEETETAVRSTLMQGSRLSVVGVCSDTISQVDTLPQCFRSLKRCIDVLRALKRDNELVSEPLFSMYALLFEQRGTKDLNSFIQASVGELISHDLRRNTNLCGTLLAYLDESQSFKIAAASLDIHVNTLRQRLETIDHLLGNWRNGSKTLEIHMALRMHSLNGSMSRVTD
ncbi:helix-turn-helix domain-containing protein [Pollutimonas bauzanensis]|uniref:GAF domain-containing protein n=1 Tax=Pollutimonas bauzanensis TaxID=658167 RepID=A0A1M5Q771_9BURK|nr:GAF domain-containing protein [Pollutimonas bauzanensis]SHH09621.1 GAF domain-containing protein [Pollutimonas bauzanensis]